MDILDLVFYSIFIVPGIILGFVAASFTDEDNVKKILQNNNEYQDALKENKSAKSIIGGALGYRKPNKTLVELAIELTESKSKSLHSPKGILPRLFKLFK